MSGPRLPLELLGLIVEHLPDRACLQNCALAASVFVHACQKRLHNQLSFTTSSDKDDAREASQAMPELQPVYTYVEAGRHLAATPHLARYVLRVNILLASEEGDDPADAEELVTAIFKGLMRVTRCALFGADGIMWGTVSSAVRSSLLEWLLAQATLVQIMLSRIAELSKAALLVLLISSPTFHVIEVSLSVDPEPGTESAEEEAEWIRRVNEREWQLIIRELRIAYASSAEDVLQQSEFTEHLNQLHMLETRATPMNLSTLCYPSAATLTMLQLNCVWLTDAAPVALPARLPQLRALQLTIGLYHLYRPTNNPSVAPQSQVLPRLLRAVAADEACPKLSEITLVVLLGPQSALPLAPLSDDIMHPLDDALQALTSLSMLRWLPVAGAFEDRRHEAVVSFEQVVLRGLPHMAKTGKIVVQDSSYEPRLIL
ncbi:hypothetical protein MIND_00385100 [Mycena indigotica]|uniref:F-box domain-containing protein n=1 Tax=Mycena indigotica TaxID=2126181 RepID=A0A8H6T4B4_9AGAR|nr:uncharacterized protein MIND_00385100 [Mycena indigotica]KAF7310117.1 hypothetical protein MIND_00385100 [Mycena indigotica]